MLMMVYMFFILPTSLKAEIETMEQIISERKKLMSTFDTSEAVLLRWNSNYTLDARAAYVSSSAKRFLGYSKAEFMKKDTLFSHCIHKDDLEPLNKELQDALDSCRSFFSHKPYRFITKDGTQKWMVHHTMLIRDKDDEVVSYISYLSDMKELRHF